MPQKVNDLLAKNIELLSVETGDAASIDKDRTYHEKKLLIFSDLLRTKNLSQLFSQNHTSVHEHLSKLISESATQLNILLSSDETVRLTSDIGQTLGLKPKADNSENSKPNPPQMAGNEEIPHVDDELESIKNSFDTLINNTPDAKVGLKQCYDLLNHVFDRLDTIVSPDISDKPKFPEDAEGDEDFIAFTTRVYSREIEGFGFDLHKLRKHNSKLADLFQNQRNYHGKNPFPNLRTKNERADYLIENYATPLLANPGFDANRNLVLTYRRRLKK